MPYLYRTFQGAAMSVPGVTLTQTGNLGLTQPAPQNPVSWHRKGPEGARPETTGTDLCTRGRRDPARGSKGGWPGPACSPVSPSRGLSTQTTGPPRASAHTGYSCRHSLHLNLS